MGYSTVDDVCSAFPRFVRNSAGSISDAQIQGWIDDRKARIRSVCMMRNFDPDAPPGGVNSVDVTNFLRSLNREGAIADLADALEANITTAAGPVALSERHRQSFESQIAEIKSGVHDYLFGQASRVTGTAGADTPVDQTPADTGQNQAFGKNTRF
ncbi:MAG: hypothetical protein DMG22_16930 [Acidobacteria bacterium]|nr:MAG: hypothetical protein DMG22_16930 [Acidobacteriota bacterium]